MKKAKLMLAGIACLAIVGGVFAFKARTGSVFYTNTTTVGGGLVCKTTTFIPFSTAPIVLGQAKVSVTGIYYTSLAVPCPGYSLYTNP